MSGRDLLPGSAAWIAAHSGELGPGRVTACSGSDGEGASTATADLRAIAATTLRRLASEMRAAAHAGARGTVDGEVAAALLAETRREAVADLGRLRDSLPLGSAARLRAGWQIGTLDGIDSAGRAAECDRWAAAWEASP